MAKEGTQLTTDTVARRAYKLKIVRHGDKFKVRSGSIDLEVGDTLEWESRGTASIVMFPTINGVEVVRPNRIPITSGGTGSAEVLNVTGIPPTEFGDVEVPYAVYCLETNNFAEGNSDPKIIVKGP